jgi:hypothetical protein
MNEHPIIFSGEMVRAILEGRKTQTRRVITQAHDGFSPAAAVYPARESGWIAWWPRDWNGLAAFTKEQYQNGFECPYGKVGDHLWVRETWKPYCITSDIRAPQRLGIIYRADNSQILNPAAINVWRMDRVNKWRPSIHMPRWASRITLEITGVRAERLQDISQADARDEGVECPLGSHSDLEIGYRLAYRDLWDSINAKSSYTWDGNNWVWAITFKFLPPLPHSASCTQNQAPHTE